MDRLLHIVNEKDEIIGSKSRTEIHSLGLLHREVHVWMFDKDKNIFFQKRGLDRPSAGLLDSTVGGHVEKNEEYIDAAIRETKEETGIIVSSSDLIVLKKVKVSNLKPDILGNTVNNFIRTIYMYSKPVEEKMLKKEETIKGGGFQKLSIGFLRELPKEYEKMFFSFMLNQELPEVLNYLKIWKK